ncbi:MAG TPA: MDR family MFS transporter [Candidatus Dormibacteraeota bacterium]|nr:MDR family MFS transporter [Candidatus Dormibacteraeota bacterium]
MSTHALPRRQVVLATTGVALALLLSALDQTVVGVAMPRIVAELHGLEFYAWVTTAYLVTSTATLPVAGKLGDMFGRKPFLLAGVVGFVAASTLCGLAQTMPELVLARAVQGVFAGVLFASTFAVLADVFPPAQMARMSGVFGAVFGLSSLVGPTLGGVLTDGPGWRWVFFVNLPIAVVAATFVAVGLPYVRGARLRLGDVDWAGTAALVGGLTPLLVALTLTRDHSWASPQVLGLLAVAAVLLAAFALIERRAAHPVVPFGLFRRNVFGVSAVIAFFSAIGMYGTVTFVPLIYQGLLGTNATNSGQLLTPMMLAVVLTATPAGALIARIPRYRFVGTAAVAVMIGGLVLLSQVGLSTGAWEVARDIVIVGAGLGVTFPLTISVVQAGLPHRLVGVATSQVNFWRSLGGAIGTAILGSILANSLGSVAGVPRVALASSLHDLFLMAAAVAAVALVATLFLREVSFTRGTAAAAEDLPTAA